MEGPIFSSLADLFPQEKVERLTKYFGFFVFILNISLILFFLWTAIFTTSDLVKDIFFRSTLGFALFGVIFFVLFHRFAKEASSVFFLLYATILLVYFMIAMQWTGGSKSFLFPIIYLFVILGSFYSFLAGSFVLILTFVYMFIDLIFVFRSGLDQIPGFFIPTIITIIFVSIFSLILGFLYRKSLVERSKLVSYTKNVSADKSKDEAILSNIGDGIYAVNTKREVIIFNASAEKITGWKSSDSLGLPCKKIMNIRDEKNNSVCEKDCPALAVWNTGQNIFRDDICFSSKTNKDIKIEGSYAPIKDIDGKVTGAICVFRDVTKKKEVERMRSEFISTASHELRTPITAISGYLELVADNKICTVDEKAKEYLGKAHLTAEAMGNLVKNLLIVTKLEDKKLEYDITNFPIKDLVSEVIEVFKRKADEKGDELSFVASPNMTIKGKVVGRSLDVRADREQIREVLNNLIENAIKFTANGKVEISVKYDDDFATVCVSDTGAGISEDGQKHLFQKFYQVDNTATREAGGTGLGLYITRSVVENLGGKIWVQSEESKGSNFFFTIPRSLD